MHRQFAKAVATAAFVIAAGLFPAMSLENYPTKPVHLLVAFPPGGPTDLVARVLGEKLAEHLGQPVIIENRPGANGNIAAEATARAEPDGYTVFYNTSAVALSPSLYAKLSYDVVRDLAPVALTAVVPLVLAVNTSIPANNVNEFIAYVRANPGKLTYGSAGAGNVTHLGALLFLKSHGLDAVHVPFRGSAPAVTALSGNHVQFVTDTVNSSFPLIQSGHIKALAVMGGKRTPVLPDVPTLSEAGMTNFEIGAWQGILVPAKTPAAIVQKLNAAALKALADPSVKAKLAIQGAEPLGSTPEEYGAYIKSELERWARVVKDNAVKLD
jgi:tripartite-type tricarboxylate transporter receptor subunit TctC